MLLRSSKDDDDVCLASRSGRASSVGRARPRDIPQNNAGRRWFTKDPRRVPQLAGTALPEEVVVQVVEEVQHLAILWPFDGAL